MKYSAAYLLTLALGAQAMCDGPGPKRIGNGWFVECTKDLYRQSIDGKDYKVDAISTRDCAEKCMQKQHAICNYQASKKKCIFGREDGVDFKSPGIVQIKRVPPYEETGSSVDDQKPMDSRCEQEKAALQTELAQVKSALADLEKGIWDL